MDERDIQIQQLKQELKSSEDRTRLIMANIPAGLLVVNNGMIEAANIVIERMFGFSRLALAQKSLSLLFPDIDTASFQSCSYLEETVAAQTGSQHFGRKSDGKRFPCEITAVSVTTKAGPREFIFVSDITERYELEQLKRDFIAMVSHDLNTPLTSVRLCLEAFGSGMYGTISDAGALTINRVSADVERLMELIGDLLFIDKVESGTLRIRRDLTRLETVTERALSSVIGLSRAKNIRVSVRFSSPESPGTSEIEDVDILLDDDRMVQVLVNLLSNAIKFSPSGSEVRIHAWLAALEICFAVVDRGEGIADSLKETIFEKYRQINSTSVEGVARIKGFGLGLAICKSIVEQHGGRIWVEDTPVSGSTFQIRIPASG